MVGGTASVSDDVLRQLRGQAAWGVHRLSGEDRYATAADACTALGTPWVDGVGGDSVLSDAALAGTPCPAGG